MKQTNDKQNGEMFVLALAFVLVVGSFVFMIAYNWNTPMNNYLIK